MGEWPSVIAADPRRALVPRGGRLDGLETRQLISESRPQHPATRALESEHTPHSPCIRSSVSASLRIRVQRMLDDAPAFQTQPSRRLQLQVYHRLQYSCRPDLTDQRSPGPGEQEVESEIQIVPCFQPSSPPRRLPRPARPSSGTTPDYLSNSHDER